MRICTLPHQQLDADLGDWIVLIEDDGLAVYGQYETAEEAILSMPSTDVAKVALVYFPSFRFEVTDNA